jgi:hypothetical protein
MTPIVSTRPWLKDCLYDREELPSAADRLVREVWWWRGMGTAAALALAIAFTLHVAWPVKAGHRLKLELTIQPLQVQPTSKGD